MNDGWSQLPPHYNINFLFISLSSDIMKSNFLKLLSLFCLPFSPSLSLSLASNISNETILLTTGCKVIYELGKRGSEIVSVCERFFFFCSSFAVNAVLYLSDKVSRICQIFIAVKGFVAGNSSNNYMTLLRMMFMSFVFFGVVAVVVVIVAVDVFDSNDDDDDG